jgi:hypothetical protein
MDATNPPTRPPTAAELLNDPTVHQALEQAWVDSQPDDPSQRHEEGGLDSYGFAKRPTCDLAGTRGPGSRARHR